MPTKFEGDPTSLSGSTGVWELEIPDFRVLGPQIAFWDTLGGKSSGVSKFEPGVEKWDIEWSNRSQIPKPQRLKFTLSKLQAFWSMLTL